MLYTYKLLRRRRAAVSEEGRRCNSRFPADELVNEKEKYKNIADEMDQAFSELSGF